MSTWARLDTQSERNDRSRYPDGAYIDIEHHLLRLALVSEIVPRANAKYVSELPPSPVRLPPTAVESRFEADKKAGVEIFFSFLYVPFHPTNPRGFIAFYLKGKYFRDGDRSE